MIKDNFSLIISFNLPSLFKILDEIEESDNSIDSELSIKHINFGGFEISVFEINKGLKNKKRIINKEKKRIAIKKYLIKLAVSDIFLSFK